MDASLPHPTRPVHNIAGRHAQCTGSTQPLNHTSTRPPGPATGPHAADPFRTVPTIPILTPTSPEHGRNTIDKLTSSQRAHLRSLAHDLKPILHVGTEGVSDAVIDSVREAFNTRELLKVKVHESAPLPVANAAEEIAREIPEAHVAQTIGRTMVLYRPFTEEPQIQLPASPGTT